MHLNLSNVNGQPNFLDTATRYCTINGTWFAKSDGSWTNYTDCIANHPAPINTLYLVSYLCEEKSQNIMQSH